MLFIAVIFLDGCKDDDFPVPPASTVPQFTFIIDNESTAPANVVFTNTSIVPVNAGIPDYTWSFGDNSFSKDVNPSHIFEKAGVYNVKLVVITSVSNEIKEVTKTILVKDPNASGVPVYFTNGTKIFRGLVNSQSPVMEQLPVSSIQGTYGMVIDTINSKLYISDVDAGTIVQSDLDGKNEKVFRSGIDTPNGLVIDYLNQQLYWDTSTGVQRADLTNSDEHQIEDFVTGQANDPEDVAIDALNRTLYWINYNGGIWMKNLDGSGEKEIIPLVEGGSILVVGNRIYFDFYNGSGDIQIKSADLDGGNIAVLATGITRIVYGLDYEPSGKKIYWGDRNAGTIRRANLDGSNAEAWYVAAGSSPRGIVFGKQP
ncbi:MAG: PKD domain-containing protein [Saprospiraceae bacterium]|jgi:PKD repeat protein|nr:PKD domain-containing protein [Candidatus Brachybacter algidus]MBK7605554.1 PKD domain-containing protein [Candidatus Brachybacter algidus]MBK8354181.1 PKD domain-containing protein [Candidatus Brachybacter algidus]MBK9025521.1 PKD domain-containing protein [Candidatus Brachybacter algidus]